MGADNFIGTGRNPHGLDLPLGLGMALAQEPKAMEAFGKMSQEQKDALIRQIQGAKQGGEAKRRIEEAVEQLTIHN